MKLHNVWVLSLFSLGCLFLGSPPAMVLAKSQSTPVPFSVVVQGIRLSIEKKEKLDHYDYGVIEASVEGKSTCEEVCQTKKGFTESPWKDFHSNPQFLGFIKAKFNDMSDAPHRFTLSPKPNDEHSYMDLKPSGAFCFCLSNRLETLLKVASIQAQDPSSSSLDASIPGVTPESADRDGFKLAKDEVTHVDPKDVVDGVVKGCDNQDATIQTLNEEIVKLKQEIALHVTYEKKLLIQLGVWYEEWMQEKKSKQNELARMDELNQKVKDLEQQKKELKHQLSMTSIPQLQDSIQTLTEEGTKLKKALEQSEQHNTECQSQLKDSEQHVTQCSQKRKKLQEQKVDWDRLRTQLESEMEKVKEKKETYKHELEQCHAKLEQKQDTKETQLVACEEQSKRFQKETEQCQHTSAQFQKTIQTLQAYQTNANAIYPDLPLEVQAYLTQGANYVSKLSECTKTQAQLEKEKHDWNQLKSQLNNQVSTLKLTNHHSERLIEGLKAKEKKLDQELLHCKTQSEHHQRKAQGHAQCQDQFRNLQAQVKQCEQTSSQLKANVKALQTYQTQVNTIYPGMALELQNYVRQGAAFQSQLRLCSTTKENLEKEVETLKQSEETKVKELKECHLKKEQHQGSAHHQYAQCQDQLRQLQKELHHSQRNFTQLQHTVQSLERYQAQVNAIYPAMPTEIQDYSHQGDKYQSKLSVCTIAKAHLDNENSELKYTQLQLKKEIDTLKEKETTMEHTLNTCQAKHDQHQTTATSLQQCQAEQSHLQTELHQFQQNSTELKDVIQNYRKREGTIRLIYPNIQNELTKYEQEGDQFQSELNLCKYAQQSLESQRDTLINEKTHLEETLDALTTDQNVEGCDKELLEQRKEYTKLETQMTQCQANSTKLVQKLNQLDTRFSNIQEANVKLQKDFNACLTRRETLETEVTSCHKVKDTLEHEKLTLEGLRTKLETEAEAMQEKKRLVIETLRECESELVKHQGKVSHLQKERNHYQANATQLQEQLDQLQIKLDHVHQVYPDMNEEIETYLTQKEGFQSKLSMCNQTKDQVQNEKKDLENFNKELKGSVTSLKADLTQMSNKLKTCETEAIQLQHQASELPQCQLEFNKLKTEIQHFQTNSTQLQLVLDELQSQLENMKLTNALTHQELEDYRDEGMEHHSGVQACEKVTTALEKEKVELERLREALRKSVQDLASHQSDLEKNLNQCQTEASQLIQVRKEKKECQLRSEQFETQLNHSETNSIQLRNQLKQWEQQWKNVTVMYPDLPNELETYVQDSTHFKSQLTLCHQAKEQMEGANHALGRVKVQLESRIGTVEDLSVEAENQLTSCKAESAQVANKLHECQTHLNAMQVESTNLKANTTQIKKKTQCLESQLKEENTKVENCQQEKMKLLNQNQDQRVQMNRLEADMKELKSKAEKMTANSNDNNVLCKKIQDVKRVFKNHASPSFQKAYTLLALPFVLAFFQTMSF